LFHFDAVSVFFTWLTRRVWICFDCAYHTPSVFTMYHYRVLVAFNIILSETRPRATVSSSRVLFRENLATQPSQDRNDEGGCSEQGSVS
jgi:hypothetical protein